MATVGVIYTRISRDREGAGLGVGRQETDCRDLAERLGWTVATVYSDNDISASTGRRRPGYQAMLKALEAGEANGVLVWHTDRLHRRPLELEHYVDVCERNGVTTHTVKAGPLDLATPSGRLVARQLGAVARYEIEHLTERIQSARAQGLKAGKWMGGRRPFGYEADGVTVRPDEARHVPAACAAVLAGRSLRSIAREWNDAGVTTSTGSGWHPTEVRRVLLNPRIAGYQHLGGEIVTTDRDDGKAVWPPIVDDELWRACRAILSDERRRTNKGRPRRWLGGGLYLCGVCGNTLRASSFNGRPGYKCDPSSHVARSAVDLDGFVSAVLIERLRQPDVADLLVPAPPDTTALHGQADGLRARLDELGRLYGDGVVDASQLAEGTRALRGRIAEVEQQLADVAASSTLGAFAVGDDPADVWAQLDVQQRRTVLDLLATVTVYPAKKGRPPGWQPGQSYFDPTTVNIGWKGQP